MLDEDVKILKRARDLVKAGWVQNTSIWYDSEADQMCYCATGALSKATDEISDDYWGARDRLLETVAADTRKDLGAPHIWSDAQQIVIFNDTPGRTKEEVIALFDVAIKKLEG